jgi:hypothetical protein
LFGGAALSGDNTGDWPALLARFNSSLLNSAAWRDHLPAEARTTGWCGLPPASEEEILEAEKRLGVSLPPSYRSFLAISNGWCPYNSFIERLLPVEQVEWLRMADPEGVSKFVEFYQTEVLSDVEYLDYDNENHSEIFEDRSEILRKEYHPDCLLVGKARLPSPVGGEMILLNPRVISADGEWEAIFFAEGAPFKKRCRTFRDLVSWEIDLLVERESR